MLDPAYAFGDAVEGTGDEPQAVLARIVIPEVPSDADIVELVSDGEVLASESVSKRKPDVSVDMPLQVTEDTITLTWDASDADGDELFSTIRYSADAGQTWRTVAVDIAGSTVELDRRSFPGSTDARIQVIVSDGVRSVAALSPSFTLPNLTPRVEILSPESGHLVSGGQGITFAASASDPEDGSLAGDVIQWSSNLDGVIGTGSELVMRADQLSEGDHVITASVTDSGGATASADIRLRVERVGEDPTIEEPVCSVQYNVYGPWPTGYTAAVVIRNLTDMPYSGWTLSWDRPTPGTTYSVWDALMVDNGPRVTVGNPSWNAKIAPGDERVFGMVVQFPEGEPIAIPEEFELNGVRCVTD